MRESLLVNYVFAHPVGHAIEALHHCYGYHRANPELRIELAMISTTPYELAELCPFIDRVHPIPLDLFDGTVDCLPALSNLPKRWNHVVDDNRGHQDALRAMFPGLGTYYDQARDYFTADTFSDAGATPPAYEKHSPFRLELPTDRTRAAERSFDGDRPRIAVLPGGGRDPSYYPSVRSWRLVLARLAERFPNAEFCLVGKLRDDGRSRTGFDRRDFDELIEAVPRTVEAIDLPLLDQLSMVAGCDVFVSPHSGFGMAALAVGTPWLSIAGNRWPEYYFNGVSFYSVLPDIDRFPCYTELEPDPEPVDDDGPRAPSMSYDRIVADLDELVDGAARLVEKRWDFDTAMTDHFGRLLMIRGGDPNRVWSFDNLHTRYLPDGLSD